MVARCVCCCHIFPCLHLYCTVGPDLVAFLKQRRKGEVKRAVEKEAAMEEGEPLYDGELEGTSHDALPSEVKDLEGSWLHMDVAEAEKLEWMTDAPVTSPDGVGGVVLLVAGNCVLPCSLMLQGSKEARFSFDGLLLPKSIELPSTMGLHHHGNDPAVSMYYWL